MDLKKPRRDAVNDAEFPDFVENSVRDYAAEKVAAGLWSQAESLQAFLALEEEVRRLGLSGIALNVFGHNVGAQALYRKLGSRPTTISLFKAVGATARDAKGPTAI